MDLEAIRKRLSTLKYSQLRKAAKRYLINANQKVINILLISVSFYVNIA